MRITSYCCGDNYEHQHNNCGTCQGLGEKVCVDRPKLHSLYGDGILTETSNLMRGKQWPVTMPDDQWTATNGRETSPGWSKSFGDLEAYESPEQDCMCSGKGNRFGGCSLSSTPCKTNDDCNSVIGPSGPLTSYCVSKSHCDTECTL